MTKIKIIEDAKDLDGKTALVRVDFNVPMQDGKVSDVTRLNAPIPTLQALREKGCKIALLSHFGRPKGHRVAEMSLAPVAEAFSDLMGTPIAFGQDCVGAEIAQQISALPDSGIILLENTRFHAGEEINDPDLAREMAKLGDLFVSDAFSASHRAHASTVGLSEYLPTFAGKSMQAELEALALALGSPKRPVLAVVGGAKVSSKIDLLKNLVTKVDALAIGGGMANTFLAAQGYSVGKSLCEYDLADTAKQISANAKAAGCDILLPMDVVVAKEFAAHADNRVCGLDEIADHEMILDAGPQTVAILASALDVAKTLVWNGPLGAFEMAPFDTATVQAAKAAGLRCEANQIVAVAGGGDTVAALNHAGVTAQFTHISTAGGAFLEWMEGKPLPGVEILKTE